MIWSGENGGIITPRNGFRWYSVISQRMGAVNALNALKRFQFALKILQFAVKSFQFAVKLFQ